MWDYVSTIYVIRLYKTYNQPEAEYNCRHYILHQAGGNSWVVCTKSSEIGHGYGVTSLVVWEVPGPPEFMPVADLPATAELEARESVILL